MSDLLAHLAYKICNAPVKRWPFPHIYVEDIFPIDFYEALLACMPDEGDYTKATTQFHGRRFANAMPNDLMTDLRSEDFTKIAVTPFVQDIAKRGTKRIETDLRLIRDQQNYQIGPHTDAPWKVLSYLFYLPPNSHLRQHGTSLYIPNDQKFRCVGGPHHPFEDFTRVYTAPFVPNSVIAFFKTNHSFHGVEPITIPCQRDVLLWNLYDSDVPHG